MERVSDQGTGRGADCGGLPGMCANRDVSGGRMRRAGKGDLQGLGRRNSGMARGQRASVRADRAALARHWIVQAGLAFRPVRRLAEARQAGRRGGFGRKSGRQYDEAELQRERNRRQSDQRVALLPEQLHGCDARAHVTAIGRLRSRVDRDETAQARDGGNQGPYPSDRVSCRPREISRSRPSRRLPRRQSEWFRKSRHPSPRPRGRSYRYRVRRRENLPAR